MLVGRSNELAVLADLVEDARRGHGGVAVVTGEAGIGKTRLAQELAERARPEGCRILWGRASSVGAPVAFRPLAEALHAGVTEDELDALVPERDRPLIQALLGTGTSPPGTPSLLALIAALRRLLVALSGEQATVLVIEDLHWADDETMEAVEYLADNLAGAAVLCLCTHRSDSGGRAEGLVEGLVARRAARLVPLEPLDRETVGEMARGCLGGEAPPAAVLDLLAARAAGVPFLVEELVAAYLSGGGPPTRRPEWWVSRRIAQAVPGSYRRLVAERLAGLDSDTRDVVSSAAVLGRRFEAPLLALITELPERRVYECLRAAVSASLVTATGEHFAATFEFRHALAREAVLAELMPAERADLALRAARSIEAAHVGVPGEWCERAADLYEQGGDALAAVRLLQESARRAINRSALASAEAVLLHARDLCAGDWMVWMGVDDLLLDTYARAGRADRVLEIGHELVAAFETRYGRHGSRFRLGGIHLRVARGVLPSGDFALAREHLDEARKAALETGDASLQARVQTLEATLALEQGHPDRALELADQTLVAEPTGVLPDVASDALTVRATAQLHRGDLAAARASFGRLRETAAGPQRAMDRANALIGLATATDVDDDPLPLWLEARELATSCGALSALVSIDLGIAWHHLDGGDPLGAKPAVHDALDGSHLLHHARLDETLACAAALQALTAAHATSASIDVTTAIENEGDGQFCKGLTTAFGRLLAGDNAGAAASLRRLPDRAATSSWWHGLEALLAAPRDGPGPSEPPTGVPAVDRVTGGYRAYAGAVHAVTSQQPSVATALIAVGDRLMPRGWRRHHARLVLADTALGADWGDPVAWASDAVEFFEHARMPRLADAGRAILRRSGARMRRKGRGTASVPPELHRQGVTSREMDVLLLAAERLTNREIGARLFVSPRTVETHVASLQRKLGLSTRADLVGVARRYGSP